MRAEKSAYIKKCDYCQRQAPISRMSAQDLTTMSPWPYAQWGIDIVGPLPTVITQKRLLLVATDYFRKWIEAEAFTSIKDKDVVQFVWKDIVYRFRIPQSIITDNGPQFDNKVYKIFCHELKIINLYSTPWYP